MAELKGVVIKTEGRHMWVATEDRGFKRYPLPAEDIKPGQEVRVPVSGGVRSLSYLRAAMVASVLLVLLASLALTVILPANSAAAYLALDINPSLELALDAGNRVLKAVPLNDDAKILLRGLQLKRLDVYQALDKIIQQSQAQGYISPEKENMVLLTFVPAKKQNKAIDISKMKQLVVNQMDAAGAAGRVGIQSSSPEERETARKEGLSLNNYLVLKKAAAKGYVKQLVGANKQTAREIFADLAEDGIKVEQLLDEFGKASPAKIDKTQPPGLVKDKPHEPQSVPGQDKKQPDKKDVNQKPEKDADANSNKEPADKKPANAEQNAKKKQLEKEKQSSPRKPTTGQQKKGSNRN